MSRDGRDRNRHPSVPRRGSAGASSTTCAAASRRRAGPPRSSSRIGRRACSWRRCRRSPATGRPSTTGGGCEARLNALPQFTTEIDGVDIHFIHVRSRHENALPLIMTHGWPGSVIELLETVGPLTDPTAHGGPPRTHSTWCCRPCPATASRASRPSSAGTPAARARVGGADAPPRLHPLRRPGRRRGRPRHGPDGPPGARGLVGIHLNLLGGARDRRPPAGESEQERAAAEAVATFRRTASATSWRRPRGRRRSATPCWIHRSRSAAWLLDHDTDSYYKISRAFVEGEPVGDLTREQHRRQHHAVLADRHRRVGGPVVLGGRTGLAAARRGQAPPAVPVPVGFTTFPGEIFAAPRSWVEAVYPGLAYFNEAGRGGHFAAWEEPELFATELRAAFRGLR